MSDKTGVVERHLGDYIKENGEQRTELSLVVSEQLSYI